MSTTLDRIESQAEAIKSCKRSIELAYAASEEMRSCCESASAELVKLMEMDNEADLERLRRRIDRIQELRRVMELGSLLIEANRALDAAWRRLPVSPEVGR